MARAVVSSGGSVAAALLSSQALLEEVAGCYIQRQASFILAVRLGLHQGQLPFGWNRLRQSRLKGSTRLVGEKMPGSSKDEREQAA